MAEIKNITLEFSCPEKLDDKLFCNRCSHTVIDFTGKTDKELGDEIKNSTKPVCGIFNQSQLSNQFLRYAAATLMATALTAPSFAQEMSKVDTSPNAVEKTDNENQEHFLGIIAETQAEPVGGYKKFLDSLASKLTYPRGLSEKGKTFVQFTVDTVGRMKDIKLVKGYNDLANKEAIRVLSELNYPFHPGRQRGKPVQTRLIIPITFDPTNKGSKLLPKS